MCFYYLSIRHPEHAEQMVTFRTETAPIDPESTPYPEHNPESASTPLILLTPSLPSSTEDPDPCSQLSKLSVHEIMHLAEELNVDEDEVVRITLTSLSFLTIVLTSSFLLSF